MNKYQLTLVAAGEYSQEVYSTDTFLDFHNDSIFQLDISFGANAPLEDFYMLPHETIEEIEPSDDNHYVLSNTKWNGLVTVIASIPPGGTIPTNPPASQLTILGYGKKRKYGKRYGHSRLSNVGNPVSVQTPSEIINTGNGAATPVILAQVQGEAHTTVQLTNDGQLFLGDLGVSGIYQGQISTDIVNFTVGSLHRVATLSGTGSGTFTHALGGIPTIAWLVPKAANSTPWFVSSFTSSQVTIGGIDVGVSWIMLLIKM